MVKCPKHKDVEMIPWIGGSRRWNLQYFVCWKCAKENRKRNIKENRGLFKRLNKLDENGKWKADRILEALVEKK